MRKPRPRTPDPAKVAEIGCPVERAALITRAGRKLGNLPPTLAAIRVAALIEAHGRGCTTVTLGAAMGTTAARVSQLLAGTEVPDHG